MAFLERSQFSKYEFANWAAGNTSEEVLGKTDETTSPRIRGMRMYNDQVNNPESTVNQKHGGWQNIKTIRVLADRVQTADTVSHDEWKLEFILIKPQSQVDDERRAKERAEAELKRAAADLAAAEAKKKVDEEKAKARAEQETKQATKKERLDRLRQLGKLGKAPFKKKTDKPNEHKGRNGSRPHH